MVHQSSPSGSARRFPSSVAIRLFQFLNQSECLAEIALRFRFRNPSLQSGPASFYVLHLQRPQGSLALAPLRPADRPPV